MHQEGVELDAAIRAALESDLHARREREQHELRTLGRVLCNPGAPCYSHGAREVDLTDLFAVPMSSPMSRGDDAPAFSSPVRRALGGGDDPASVGSPPHLNRSAASPRPWLGGKGFPHQSQPMGAIGALLLVASWAVGARLWGRVWGDAVARRQGGGGGAERADDVAGGRWPTGMRSAAEFTT